MSQLTTIALGQTTFYPVRVDANGVAHLRTRAESVSDSKVLSLQTRAPSKNGVTKVTGRYAYPFWYTAKNDTAKKAREIGRAEITVLIPANASLAIRQEIYKELKALVDSAAFKDSVEQLESLF